MIEFNALIAGRSRVMVLLVSMIGSCEQTAGGHTAVTLTDGRELTALVPYERFRAAILTTRNQFVSLVEAPA